MEILKPMSTVDPPSMYYFIICKMAKEKEKKSTKRKRDGSKQHELKMSEIATYTCACHVRVNPGNDRTHLWNNMVMMMVD